MTTSGGASTLLSYSGVDTYFRARRTGFYHQGLELSRNGAPALRSAPSRCPNPSSVPVWLVCAYTASNTRRYRHPLTGGLGQSGRGYARLVVTPEVSFLDREQF